jgi:glycosyltransferase involved in cell wall biosynthesis
LISGFTILRNGSKYDYPFVESIKSVLPIVDEMIVCLGNSDDDTEQKIRDIQSPKIKIVHSIWDDAQREGGKVLALETNKAKAACHPDSKWLVYIQADEVLPSEYYAALQAAMQQYATDDRVEGLLVNFVHFYGSYKYIADGIKWYSKEVRIIKNDATIHSYRDAQGFRKNQQKLRVKQIPVDYYHYGWVRNPIDMLQKNIDFGQYWRNPAEQKAWKESQKQNAKNNQFDYTHIDSIRIFEKQHPQVMQARIAQANWDVQLSVDAKQFKNIKHRIFYQLLQRFGWRPFEYKNYKKI